MKIKIYILQSSSIVSIHSFIFIKELPAVRRTQPITKKAKISSTTHIHCYNGYMVNNNNIPVAATGGYRKAQSTGRGAKLTQTPRHQSR